MKRYIVNILLMIIALTVLGVAGGICLGMAVVNFQVGDYFKCGANIIGAIATIMLMTVVIRK